MKYKVHVNNSFGVVVGIVRIQLQAIEQSDGLEQVEFIVELVGDQLIDNISKIVVPAETHESWIGFHSHLLENNVYKIRWSANEDSGEVEVRVRNTGDLAEKVSTQLNKDSVNLFLTGPCDTSLYNYNEQDIIPWYDKDNYHRTLDSLIHANKIDQKLEPCFRQFLDEGWFEIENHVEAELLDRLLVDLEHAAANGDSGFTPGSSQRLQRMHLKYQSFWDLTTYNKTQNILDQLMQVPTTVSQIIAFVNGTQQAAHQDTVHLTVYPRGYMCGAWVALEDVQPDSGELLVYPRSHRWDAVTMNDFGIQKVHNGQWTEFLSTVGGKWQSMINDSGVEPFIYRPKAGSLLVWHDRLMHGGSVRNNTDLTRKSCVTHHFAQGSVVFYDSTGLPGRTIERDENRMLGSLGK